MNRKVSAKNEWVVLSCCFGVEVMTLLVFLSIYRLSVKGGVLEHLGTPWGGVLLAGSAGGLLLMWIMGAGCYYEWRAGSRKMLLAVTMGLCLVCAFTFMAEVSLKLIAVPHPWSLYDEVVGGVTLQPREWGKVTGVYTQVLATRSMEKAFLVSDQVMGWTVGPNRSSESGMYVSSSDGLRSGSIGGSVREDASPCRIALIGDSFTFGEGVRFEDTWGSVLGEALGTHCQILNFGVPGYGIDQIYLRYMKDVRSWHPTIVIASFIEDDLWRTMSVYAFLKFPAAKFPFTKPRFVLDDGGRLILARRPDASLEEPFRHASIHDLPGISYDAMYAPMEWEQVGWEWVSRSYLLRSLVSLHPVFNISRPEVSKEAMLDLNSQLLLSLRREIAVDGANLLVVAMPAVEEDLKDGAAEGLGAKLLGGHKVPYTDLRVCLKTEASADLFNPPSAGGHYSPKGNRLVARCLLEEVRASF